MSTAKANIYIVDDDLSASSSLCRMLNTLGYTCERFECPEVFLNKAIINSPAVILLDMRMPKMSGTDLQEVLLALGRTTPIIMMSGEASNGEIIKSMKLGVIDFLLKPFDIPNLLEVIDCALTIDTAYSKTHIEVLKIKARYNTLTKREKEICEVLISGALSKTIAVELRITPATIKVHKANILKKMGARNILELSKFVDTVKQH
jgi:FixJ family two-component response regulator